MKFGAASATLSSLTRVRPHLTYSNVVATICLFFVLGGGAYAASKLPRNSVGTKQLKKNAVTGPKVRDRTLTPKDFARGTLLAGEQGEPGPPGPVGPSHGYQASGSVNYDSFSSSLFGSTVVSVAVPPGPYFATASVQAETVNNVASIVTCRLINGNGGAGSAATSRTQSVRLDNSTDNFTLTGLFQVREGQSLNLQCSKSAEASSARVSAANIVALQLEEIAGITD